ncbi:hypothetical protein [Dyadobacter frigoris]|uniref:Outer membrane protein beta-barrel domain-containing protein n=1 Tax=Dyadobacter frigoris TaxID=2576211 RepID=A0A4U6CZR3_9BACT|nr:hypothetical protein [Dyadobacter frigoris]TKT90339.1 hypothetical protein FDK13_21645 [Dyadobacter frigoris]GLU52582.1 hypothetical protein Dfri01_20430 [Dyadobacter frigoris]
MKTKVIALICFLITACTLKAQQTKNPNINQFVDLAGTIGKSQGTGALSYVYNWRIGKKRKIEAGLGARLTSVAGTKLTYTTAGPARLTRTFTTPFVIFFAGQKTENWDTLTVQRPFVNALNVTINLGYNFTPKLSAGFNIDLIGASFGRKSSSIFKTNGEMSTDPVSKPTTFNLLLTGDHDQGSLNSEFFIKYMLGDKWGVRAIYQFLFTEYTAGSVKQTAPDGTVIDRFRNKANNFGLGVSYRF